MMHLIEGKKFLDTNVFDGRQETAKPIVANIVAP